MKIGKVGRLAAGAALLSVLAFAGAAQASCDKSDRVSHLDANCLTATWTNRSWDASNTCNHTIKIKIDVKNGSDKTRTIEGMTPTEVCDGDDCYTVNLSNSSTGSINTDWGRKIRSVTCCSDYSECS